MMRRIVLVLLLAAMLASGVCAATDVLQEEAAILGADKLEDALPDEAADALNGISPLGPGSFSDGFKQVLSSAVKGLGGWMRSGVRVAAGLLAVALLCGMGSGYGGAAARMAGCLGIAAVCTSSLYGMIALARETLDGLGNFSALLLPVLSAALTASGGVTSGSAIYAGATLLISVLTSLIRSFLIPCVYCYFFLAVAQYAIGDDRLECLRELAGWTVKTALRAAVAAFTGYLALTGLLAGTADEMALKAAKSVISTAIPVVGGMISEASQAVLTSAALIRSSAGVFGLLAVLAMGLGPFLQIAVQYLALRVTAALSGFLAMQEHTKLLSCAADAMGDMLAMTGSAMLMVIVAVCTLIRVVNG